MRTDVGKCVKMAQIKNEISTAKMAEDFGVFRQQIQRWRSANDMRLHKIEELADYFGMSRDEFLKLGE